ncbi:ANFC protein, partial [Alca torda]|nr:ANFC protein [Alca torda]
LKLLFCPGFLLMLIVSQNQARARPISSLQSLSKLLDEDLVDEDLEHPLVSEERDREQHDMIPTGAFDQQDTEFQWTRNTRDQPESMSMGDSAVQRFFSHLLNLPRRYQGRSKKGLSRGCFGVKLDRIGSLSGLGC